MLLLPEGQTGEAWGLYKKQCSFGNRVLFDKKITFLNKYLNLKGSSSRVWNLERKDST
jgi:hypothetical protein